MWVIKYLGFVFFTDTYYNFSSLIFNYIQQNMVKLTYM
jgi:hypothetical protein